MFFNWEIHTEGEEDGSEILWRYHGERSRLGTVNCEFEESETLGTRQKEINLGDDVYQDQPVKYESVSRVSEALTGFVQILNDYGVTNYKLFGSSALHQAMNSDFIADQLFLHTGMTIEWLSSNEETYFRNQNISIELGNDKQNEKRTVFLVGITSGNTAITEFKKANLWTPLVLP